MCVREKKRLGTFLFSPSPPIIFISWRLINLQYCSGCCHTLTWISHGFTRVPHPDPPSRLPPHPIPLGHPRAPAPSTCLIHPWLDTFLYWLRSALWLPALPVSFTHIALVGWPLLLHLQFSLERAAGHLLLRLRAGSACGSPPQDPGPVGQLDDVAVTPVTAFFHCPFRCPCDDDFLPLPASGNFNIRSWFCWFWSRLCKDSPC